MSNKKLLEKGLKLHKSLGNHGLIYGSIAFLYFTKDKNYLAKDIDIIVSNKFYKEIIRKAKEKNLRYKLIGDRCVQIFDKENLIIEYDSLEHYFKKFKITSKEVSYLGFEFNIISKENLLEIYLFAYKNSKDIKEFW